MILGENNLPDIGPLLDFSLAQHFPSIEVVSEDGVGGGDDEFELVPAVEKSKDLHLIGEPEYLFLVIACNFLEVDLGG